ncbi:MAG: hypothetical protein KDC44_10705 [Phaeodactylibacter sp.]|nr:hypothetical protein [Phaeodactylibacter sp.]
MNRFPIRYPLLIPLLLLHTVQSAAQQSCAACSFVITWDNKLIQGEILDIYYADWRTDVTFRNAFGRTYQFSPARVGGFLQIEDQDTMIYESKYAKDRWLFLRRVHKAEQLSLYQSPQWKWALVRGVTGMEQIYMPVNEVWLEFRKKRPFRIYPLTYKKELRRRFAKFPDLADKIGTTGYKFKDIHKIVMEYNELYALNQRRI